MGCNLVTRVVAPLLLPPSAPYCCWNIRVIRVPFFLHMGSTIKLATRAPLMLLHTVYLATRPPRLLHMIHLATRPPRLLHTVYFTTRASRFTLPQGRHGFYIGLTWLPWLHGCWKWFTWPPEVHGFFLWFTWQPGLHGCFVVNNLTQKHCRYR